MKYLISNRQYNLIKENDRQEILEIPYLDIFGDDWELLQKFLERRGNPPYSIGGDLNLSSHKIKSLGNLVSVGGFLDLGNSEITSLGNLVSVGGYLDLYNTKIVSLGNLVSVGEYLDLEGTPISETMSNKEIRAIVNVGGKIYL